MSAPTSAHAAQLQAWRSIWQILLRPVEHDDRAEDGSASVDETEAAAGGEAHDDARVAQPHP